VKRNPEATCSTCPYWYDYGRREDGLAWTDKAMGSCRRRESPHWHQTAAGEWCGEHPDFALVEEVEAAKPVPKRGYCAGCGVPIATDEIYGILCNDGCLTEALRHIDKPECADA